MSNCQELQNKISQLKDLKQKFEASYADFQKQIEIAPSDENAKRLALDELEKQHQAIESIINDPELNIKGQWQKFYQEVIKKAIPDYQVPDFTNLKIPEYQEGFGWTVIMDKNLTYKQIKEVCEASFNCRFSFIPQDINLDQEERSPKNGSYAIRIRNREEADKENFMMSANQIREQKIKTMTLLERMTLELYYWWSNSEKHLDDNNTVTRCSSRGRSTGHFPGVRLSGRTFEVIWCSLDYSRGEWRSRTVIA